MKIIIPMNEQEAESGVCPSFGRAPYFMLYDTDTDKSQWLQNRAAQSSGGAGIAAAQLIADSGADALITPRCGENAQQVLHGAHIKLYRAVHQTAQQNIDALINGTLSPLTEFHAGFHGHGG